jgi:hypothetical protein
LVSTGFGIFRLELDRLSKATTDLASSIIGIGINDLKSTVRAYIIDTTFFTHLLTD